MRVHKIVSIVGIAAGLTIAGATVSPAEVSVPDFGSAGLTVGSIGAATPPPTPVENGTLPALHATTVLDGLDHPWDVVQAPDGAVLTGERSGRFVVRRPDGSAGPLQADLTDLYAHVETGLMGIALAPDFASTRTLYTCQGRTNAGHPDVVIAQWTVDPAWTALTRTGTVLTGIPVNEGRHGGCRVLAAPDKTLYIGTGDTATPTVPQDRNSLGGKTLHINADGTPAAGNPFAGSPIFTLGHRNPQGLALQPGTGRVYAIEQGTDRDDEVNLLRSGANYGWRPDRIPGLYDESVPMTDPIRVPGAVTAAWASGYPTLATASGTFVSGKQWGPWDGALVMGCLKSQQLAFVRLATDGRTATAQARALAGVHGRIRSVTAAPDGSLLVTTDNGKTDQVLRVAP